MPATLKRGRRRSSSRLRKIECPGCGCILYGSAAAIRTAGLPGCACGGTFTVPLLRDLEVIDPDGFEQLLATLDRKSHTQAMRELGYLDAIERRAPPRRTRQPQCANDGCSRFRAYGERYCPTCLAEASLPF